MARKNNPIGKKKIAVVAARFNETITQRLVDGCLDELKRLKVARSQVELVWVPGAFEIPAVALKLAQKKNIHAVICLGAVIKGETLHYELVAGQAAAGIMSVSLQAQKPVVFEVLATETIELANQRSKTRGINKGRDAAQTAFEMINIFSKISRI